ncbi:hypothetical protein [Paraburkholderia azotifigens]|nr:hypothetical protein [Paraburkholderia azotifigens]
MLTSLATIDGEHARVVAYLQAHQAHLLNAYSAEFLCAAILARKSAQAPDVLPTRVVASGDAERASRSVFSISQYFSDDAVPALAGA